MQKKPSITNSAMRYGLFLGLAFSVNFLMSISSLVLLKLLSNLMTLVILYLVFRFATNYRDKELGGFISYRRGFLFVTLLFVFASIISAAIKFVYFNFIKPDFLSEMMNQTLATLDEILPEMPEQAYDTISILSDPLNFSVLSIWSNTLIGVGVALIMAAIVKRNRSPFDTTSN